MSDKEQLLNFCDKLIDNNKKQIQKAEHKGDLTRVYFHEGSLSAIAAMIGELKK